MTLPSITALRCLDASARLLSFTRAAVELHLTQSAVSHHILNLERDLGVPLFVRNRAGLKLTDAGRSYWAEISSALRQLERATETIQATGGLGGVLNISVSTSLGSYWLMPRLHDFATKNPDITLNLSTRIGPLDFSTNQEDASIEFCVGREEGLAAFEVMPLVLRPYIAFDALSPKAQETMRREGVLSRKLLVDVLNTHQLVRRSTVLDAWPGWIAASKLDGEIPDKHLVSGPRYSLLSMALSAASQGLGIALLPKYVASGAVEAGSLCCISAMSWKSSHSYYLRWPLWRPELEALNRFRLWLETQMAESQDN